MRYRPTKKAKKKKKTLLYVKKDKCLAPCCALWICKLRKSTMKSERLVWKRLHCFLHKKRKRKTYLK